MEFSVGLSKLHENPLSDEDALLNECTKRGHLAGSGKDLLTPANVMSD